MIGLIVFLLVILADTTATVFSFDFSARLLAFLIVSLLCGIIIQNGFSFFIPSFKDSVIALRQMYRFESLSHPLLLRLSYEAPGTYHHSINTAILAQKAAKSVNADPLLVRVGAYYHDIGKLENPTQYIENQSGAEIPRNEDIESIKKNANKIILHVSRGVAIAETNHLPKEVIDLIAQHHGTTHMLYYYEKAKETGLKFKKTDFRYDGPAPQSKEAAILMLSDSCEAAARAVINLTPEIIKDIVKNAVNDKIADKQLKNSGLANSDIIKITQSLEETLASIYHQRISK